MKNHILSELKKDGYRLCPSCGYFSHIDERQNYCTLCGSKLIEECAECKEVIGNPTGRYCPYCGGSYRV